MQHIQYIEHLFEDFKLDQMQCKLDQMQCKLNYKTIEILVYN